MNVVVVVSSVGGCHTAAQHAIMKCWIEAIQCSMTSVTFSTVSVVSGTIENHNNITLPNSNTYALAMYSCVYVLCSLMVRYCRPYSELP